MIKKSLRIQQIYDYIGLPGHNPGNGKFYVSNDGYDFDNVYEIKGKFRKDGKFTVETTTETLSTEAKSWSIQSYDNISEAALDIHSTILMVDAVNDNDECGVLQTLRDTFDRKIDDLKSNND